MFFAFTPTCDKPAANTQETAPKQQATCLLTDQADQNTENDNSCANKNTLTRTPDSQNAIDNSTPNHPEDRDANKALKTNVKVHNPPGGRSCCAGADIGSNLGLFRPRLVQMIAILEELLEASLVRFLSIFSISHVAIVLDGNRRYAKSMGISQLEGHKQGALLIKKVLPLFIKLRIKYVSMFVFSIENFSRERENVDNTFRVIRDYIVAEEDWLNECNSRVVVSGKIEMLPGDLMETLSNLELKTRKNTGIVLNICCAYSSTSELELASKRYLNSLKDSHQVSETFLSDEKFKSFIYNPEIPFPNILIRTSGETRLSDFLIYQACHNTRIYFLRTLWPQISNLKILIIILHYVIFYL
ncbi:hypothetical protein OIY81_3632 [Cryptosporidium canis]|nr:hypothetical protein OIY81_3632 [Cryptosporidium canis]